MNKMNDPMGSTAPEPRKVGVWAEGTRFEAKELVIPKKSPESSDDIPTIPDLDDLQDILDTEISVPPVAVLEAGETALALAALRGAGGGGEGVDAAVDILMGYVPQVPSEVSDTVWTVDSLLTTLSEEIQEETDNSC